MLCGVMCAVRLPALGGAAARPARHPAPRLPRVAARRAATVPSRTCQRTLRQRCSIHLHPLPLPQFIIDSLTHCICSYSHSHSHCHALSLFEGCLCPVCTMLHATCYMLHCNYLLAFSFIYLRLRLALYLRCPPFPKLLLFLLTL